MAMESTIVLDMESMTQQLCSRRSRDRRTKQANIEDQPIYLWEITVNKSFTVVTSG